MIQIIKKIEYGEELYWDDEYHLLIDGEEYILVDIGSYSGYIETSRELQKKPHDYLKDRLSRELYHTIKTNLDADNIWYVMDMLYRHDGEDEWKEEGDIPNKEEELKDECNRLRDELKMYKDQYEELKRSINTLKELFLE